MKDKREIQEQPGTRWWYLVFLVAPLLLLASFYFDDSAQAWMAQPQAAGTKALMRGVSRFGDWQGHVVVGLALLGIAYWRGRKRWMRIFAAMILACALAGVGAQLIKVSTGRARPNIKAEPEWIGLSFSAGYKAFPSGHTAASTAFFATLALASWRLGAGCLVIPLLIGFSRMYLEKHYFSDVVGGVLVGFLAAYFTVRWRLRERSDPQPG